MNLYNYLIRKGYTPVRKNEREAWFKSPLRNEATASFKVDIRRNIWFDFGEQIGGGFKDLIEKLGDDISTGNIDFNFENSNLKVEKKKCFFIENISNITAPKLLEYLSKRKISIEIAGQFCSQINYKHGQKYFYSIGFKNDFGGYELRNAIFKNCIGKKTKTHLKNGSNHLVVFEGFFDFLSFIELFPKSRYLDFLVLNSVGFYQISKPIFEAYNNVSLYLDNDPAGSRTTEAILTDFPHAKDCRELYEEYGDLNDFLIEKYGGKF